MYNRPHNGDRKLLPFFPAGPSDALVLSRCIAYHLMAGNRSVTASKIILFGNEYARSVDPFGANLRRLVEVLPKYSYSIDFLLERSTLFGFYSEALSHERKDMWRQNQISGDARLVNKFITGHSGQSVRLIKEHLHFCSACALEDEQAFGISHWRVVHQIPGVYHCPKHFLPLSSTCSQCGLAAASEDAWHPPSEKCPHCGGHDFSKSEMKHLPVYVRFIELCDSVVRGIHVGLGCADRKRIYSRFLSTVGTGESLENQTEKLIEILLSRWQVSNLEQPQAVLQTLINRKFIAQSITFQDTIQSPIGHLALIAALEFEGEQGQKLDTFPLTGQEVISETLSAECMAALAELACNPGELLKTMNRICDEHGLPNKLGILLLERGLVHARRQFRVDQNRVARLRTALNKIDFCAEEIVDISNPNLAWLDISSITKFIRKCRAREQNRKSILDFLSLEKFDPHSPQRIFFRHMNWCNKYDRQWLDRLQEVHPSVGRITADCRSALTMAIKNGCRILSAVHRNAPAAVEWCRLIDAPWMNVTLPPTRYEELSFKKKKERCRRMILLAIEAGITNRSDMPKRAKRWCLHNDREWLDKTVPYGLSCRARSSK